MAEISAQERAEKCLEAMWANDSASQWVGLTVERVAPGAATVSLLVKAHHCNSHDICHGGISFTLADSAFAFACNTYNQVVVAQHNSITYLAPAFKGDVLKAEAVERVRQGRSGVYDVSIRNQNGDLIAEFRGGSRVIRGQHFEESET